MTKKKPAHVKNLEAKMIAESTPLTKVQDAYETGHHCGYEQALLDILKVNTWYKARIIALAALNNGGEL